MLFSYLKDAILSNWVVQFEVWKGTSGACTHLMYFTLSTTTFPSWGLACMQQSVVSWVVPAPQALLQGAEEENKYLYSSKCVIVPTHCCSILTGMLQNRKEIDWHLTLLSCFCLWTKPDIAHRWILSTDRVSIPQISIRVLLLFQENLRLDSLWLSLGFVRQQLRISYSHWW